MTTEKIIIDSKEFFSILYNAKLALEGSTSVAKEFVKRYACDSRMNINVARKKESVSVIISCPSAFQSTIFTYKGNLASLYALVPWEFINPSLHVNLQYIRREVDFVNLRQEFEFLDKEPLGKGSYGSIWRVKKDGKIYALKIEEPFRDGLFNEANTLKVIRDKMGGCDPRIVCLYNYFEAWFDGKMVRVLQLGFVEGVSLDVFAQNNNNIEKWENIALKAFETVSLLHSLDIYHMDIKPENIMITPSEEIVLVDFGFSCSDSDEKILCPVPFTKGTPLFLSVDRYRYCNSKTEKEKCDAKVKKESDVWALALSIWSLINNPHFDTEVLQMWEKDKKRGQSAQFVPRWIQKQWREGRWNNENVDPVSKVMQRVLLQELRTAQEVVEALSMLKKRTFNEMSESGMEDE